LGGIIEGGIINKGIKTSKKRPKFMPFYDFIFFLLRAAAIYN